MKEKIIIIGAGISGLTTAYFLKKPYACGLCASFYEDGFVFDCSEHFMHVKNKEIKNTIEKLTRGLLKIERNAAIYAKKINLFHTLFKQIFIILTIKQRKNALTVHLGEKTSKFQLQCLF
jgi:protoporphyrinogen oxidase